MRIQCPTRRTAFHRIDPLLFALTLVCLSCREIVALPLPSDIQWVTLLAAPEQKDPNFLHKDEVTETTALLPVSSALPSVDKDRIIYFLGYRQDQIAALNPPATEIVAQTLLTTNVKQFASPLPEPTWAGRLTNARVETVNTIRFPLLTGSWIPEDVNDQAVEVAAGQNHACARMRSGRMVCWGTYFGTYHFSDSRPHWVEEIDDAIQIALGADHSCVLRSNQQVMCFGVGAQGQLGVPQNHSTTPLLSKTNVVQVTAGRRHTCAVVNGGRVNCWGDNTYGQLGDANTTITDIPLIVLATGRQPLENIVQVDAYDDRTCARTQSGATWCWGKLKTANLPLQSSAATQIPLPPQTHVATGHNHSCAITNGGSAFCWSDLTTLDFVGPSDSQTGIASVTGLAQIDQIAAANDVTCALSAGEVYCWGSNTDGILGVPPGEEQESTLHKIPRIRNATNIAVGGTFACAITRNGQIHCWGRNDRRQLGFRGREPELIEHTPSPILNIP